MNFLKYRIRNNLNSKNYKSMQCKLLKNVQHDVLIRMTAILKEKKEGWPCHDKLKTDVKVGVNICDKAMMSLKWKIYKSGIKQKNILNILCILLFVHKNDK